MCSNCFQAEILAITEKILRKTCPSEFVFKEHAQINETCSLAQFNKPCEITLNINIKYNFTKMM